jgi:hypothetical protein
LLNLAVVGGSRCPPQNASRYFVGGTMAKVERDESYHDKGLAFLYVLIEVADHSLLESGVTDIATRRAIVTNIAFGMGNFLDQYWMKVNGEKIYPLVCFTKTFLNVNTAIDEISPLLAPSTSFAYHEYAMGCIAAYYRGDEPSKIESGYIGT